MILFIFILLIKNDWVIEKPIVIVRVEKCPFYSSRSFDWSNNQIGIREITGGKQAKV